MLYNPAQMDKEELYSTFVAREKLLLELLETIGENTGKKSIQHIILVGARGIGKTHMLRIIENKVLDLHYLQSKWVTVNVPEEQYGVFCLIDFFEYILKIIFHSSQLEKVDKDTYRKEIEEIQQNKNKESLDKLVSIFKDISQKEKKQFLLLVDNIDKILAEKIREEKELEYLRSILMTENFFMIIGTSTSIFEEIALYNKAFFRFFKIIHLQNLNDTEVEMLLHKRAKFDKIADKIKLDENKNKIKAITDLTGGYPRLILMLYEILEDKPLLDVLKTFNKLLDNLTPYYKHRMDDLAPQQQKIIDIIMLSDGVASPTDVAKNTSWKPTVVTSQFKRLKDLNILRIKESKEIKKRKSVYEISDRLFVIWYQMRYLGVLKRRIEYIVTFLKIWYDLKELKDKISLYALQYQQHYSTGNFSESYSYARSISIISYAITEISEREKIISEQVKRYINAGKFEDALNDQKDLLKIHEEVNNRQGMANDYGNMGIVFQLQGDLQKSLEYYEKALKLSEELGHKEGIASVFGNMGNVYRIRGDLDKALEYYGKALKLDEELERKEGMANQFGNIGNVYGIRGDLDKALEYFGKALKLDEELERKEGMANRFGNIGNVYGIRGDLDKALEYFGKALKLDEELERKEGMASVFGNMGNVYRIRGDLDKALEYFGKALKLDEELGCKEGMAADFGNMGIVYQIRGDLDKALEYYEKALKLDEELERKEGMAKQFGNIGIVYGIRGDFGKALEYFGKALKLDEELGRKEGMANQFGNMGNVYRIRGDLDKALEYYGKALKLDEELGRKEGMAAVFGNMGIVYQIRGDLDKALEYYGKSLKLDEELGRKEGMANQFGNIGNVYQIRGDLDKALEYYGKSLKIEEELGRKEGMANQFGNMGIVFHIQGDLRKSLEYHEKALKIFKEIGNNLNYNIIVNNKINLLLRSAITNNKEKNAGMALRNIEAVAESIEEKKSEDTIKIIVSAIFELLKDSEYDFAITIMEILQKEHKDIFEICEPFMISAKYLKTNDSGILENASSIVLEGVKKILGALEKQKNETE